MSVIVDCRRPSLDDVLEQIDSAGPATAAAVVAVLVADGFLYPISDGGAICTQIGDLHELGLIERTPVTPCVWKVTAAGRAMAVRIRGAR
jgi:hypothetical protein